jgi:PAS domain S-box-containing protein
MGDGADGSTALPANLEAGHVAQILRAADLGVWDWNLLTDSIIWSPRAKVIFGFDTDKDVTIDQVRAATHTDDREWSTALTRRALDPALKERPTYEYRIVRPDGSVRWVVARGEVEFAVIDGVERAVRYIGTLQDITELRRLAQAEQRASDRLRLAMEAGRMAVWDFDVATQSVTGSPELNRLMGFPVDAQPTLDEFQACYLPGEGDRIRDEVAAALAAGETSIETEFRSRGPDGAPRWLMLRAEVDLGQDGQPLHVVGVLLDVTDRRVAEQARRESEARFRIMADSAPSPVWVTAIDGGIEFVNEAFAEYAGRRREDLIGDVWLQLLHPGDVAQVVSARNAARESLAPYSFEARFRHGDGRYRWMLASTKPRFNAAGVFEGYVGIAVDMTERRLAQEALQESEQRFRQMAEGAPTMLWVGDENGGCVYLNKALRDFWGVSEDLSQFKWAATLIPEDIEQLFAAFNVAMARQAPFEVEARYYRADGAVRWLLTRAEPRRDAAGRFLGMHGVNMDVTEIREAAAKQRLLINELNHRVKNSLTAVQSMVRQSLRPGVAIEVARENLVDRLIALSKAHDVLTQREWESVQLADVVAQALSPFDDPSHPRFDVEGASARLGPNAALAVALALHELGTNAVKYGALSAPEGRVSLHWTIGDDQVRLTWRETGGPPVTPPTRQGFGTRLLQRGLAGDMADVARLDFAPTGLIADFAVKAEV